MSRRLEVSLIKLRYETFSFHWGGSEAGDLSLAGEKKGPVAELKGYILPLLQGFLRIKPPDGAEEGIGILCDRPPQVP